MDFLQVSCSSMADTVQRKHSCILTWITDLICMKCWSCSSRDGALKRIWSHAAWDVTVCCTFRCLVCVFYQSYFNIPPHSVNVFLYIYLLLKDCMSWNNWTLLSFATKACKFVFLNHLQWFHWCCFGLFCLFLNPFSARIIQLFSQHMHNYQELLSGWDCS